jgi:5-methylcytosine-specific restriction enzyme A
MPHRAPTGCRYPGCPALLVTPGYCDRHKGFIDRNYDRARRAFDPVQGFYQSNAWRKCRAAFLRAHPLCRRCANAGQSVAARMVDHIKPIKSGGARLDWSNLQSLCFACHNRKTARDTRQTDDP